MGGFLAHPNIKIPVLRKGYKYTLSFISVTLHFACLAPLREELASKVVPKAQAGLRGEGRLVCLFPLSFFVIIEEGK